MKNSLFRSKFLSGRAVEDIKHSEKLIECRKKVQSQGQLDFQKLDTPQCHPSENQQQDSQKKEESSDTGAQHPFASGSIIGRYTLYNGKRQNVDVQLSEEQPTQQAVPQNRNLTKSVSDDKNYLCAAPKLYLKQKHGKNTDFDDIGKLPRTTAKAKENSTYSHLIKDKKDQGAYPKDETQFRLEAQRKQEQDVPKEKKKAKRKFTNPIELLQTLKNYDLLVNDNQKNKLVIQNCVEVEEDPREILNSQNEIKTSELVTDSKLYTLEEDLGAVRASPLFKEGGTHSFSATPDCNTAHSKGTLNQRPNIRIIYDNSTSSYRKNNLQTESADTSKLAAFSPNEYNPHKKRTKQQSESNDNSVSVSASATSDAQSQRLRQSFQTSFQTDENFEEDVQSKSNKNENPFHQSQLKSVDGFRNVCDQNKQQTNQKNFLKEKVYIQKDSYREGSPDIIVRPPDDEPEIDLQSKLNLQYSALQQGEYKRQASKRARGRISVQVDSHQMKYLVGGNKKSSVPAKDQDNNKLARKVSKRMSVSHNHKKQNLLSKSQQISQNDSAETVSKNSSSKGSSSGGTLKKPGLSSQSKREKKKSQLISILNNILVPMKSTKSNKRHSFQDNAKQQSQQRNNAQQHSLLQVKKIKTIVEVDEELEEKSSCWGTSEPLFNDMASQYAGGCEVLKSENGGQTNRTKFNIDSPLPMNQSSQAFSFAKVLPAIKPSVNTLQNPSNSKNLIQRVRMSNLMMMAEAQQQHNTIQQQQDLKCPLLYQKPQKRFSAQIGPQESLKKHAKRNSLKSQDQQSNKDPPSINSFSKKTLSSGSFSIKPQPVKEGSSPQNNQKAKKGSRHDLDRSYHSSMVIDTAQEYLTRQKANERRNLLSQIRKLDKKELERFPMIVQYAKARSIKKHLRQAQEASFKSSKRSASSDLKSLLSESISEGGSIDSFKTFDNYCSDSNTDKVSLKQSNSSSLSPFTSRSRSFSKDSGNLMQFLDNKEYSMQIKLQQIEFEEKVSNQSSYKPDDKSVTVQSMMSSPTYQQSQNVPPNRFNRFQQFSKENQTAADFLNVQHGTDFSRSRSQNYAQPTQTFLSPSKAFADSNPTRKLKTIALKDPKPNLLTPLNLQQLDDTSLYSQGPKSITTMSVISSRKDGKKQINQYLLLKQIGSGNYAKVFMCLNDQDKQIYAMKCINKRKLNRMFIQTRNQAYNFLETEMAILKKLDHPNVLQLFEILDDPSLNKLYIVTEIVKKGTLGEALAKRMLSTEEVRRYFRDLISALEYCHDVAGVIHRDIKPENILIDQNDRVKLADFGVSYIMDDGCDEITTKAGSNFFFSPEACKGTKYKGKGSDVWAAGVTLYYMCMRAYPFISNNFPDLFYKIQYDEPDYPNTLHPLLDDLLKKILNKNPEDRLTIPQIKEHPWITKSGADPMPELTQRNKIDVSETDLKSVFTKVRRVARVILEFKKLQSDNKALASSRSNSSMQQSNQGKQQILDCSTVKAPQINVDKFTNRLRKVTV